MATPVLESYCESKTRRRRRRSARSRLGPYSDAPWPCPISRLHRSAGGVSLLSFRVWSIHLQRGRPGRRFHLGSGFRPSDNLTWARRAWWAGTVVSNLAMWPKTALRRREIMSDMDGSPVVAVISLRTNCCQLTCSICLWHFMWNASKVLRLEASTVHVSAAYNKTDVTRACKVAGYY